MADPRLCIGCRTCEVACAVAHRQAQEGPLVPAGAFTPRVQVLADRQIGESLRTLLQQQPDAPVTAPLICRQCEEMPCASVCPNQAIARVGGVVSVVPSRCIGCKSCMVACPYGAMQVVARASACGGTGVFRSLSNKAEALKCDLCVHRSAGPACVEVCPTRALRLVRSE